VDLCGTSSLKQQSTGKQVASLGHIILIPGKTVSYSLKRGN